MCKKIGMKAWTGAVAFCTCPLQQDAITSILQVAASRRQSTRARIQRAFSFFLGDTHWKYQRRSIAVARRHHQPPLKYGARFAFYRSMLESYGSAAAAAASFDLAARQSEGGGGKIPEWPEE